MAATRRIFLLTTLRHTTTRLLTSHPPPPSLLKSLITNNSHFQPSPLLPPFHSLSSRFFSTPPHNDHNSDKADEEDDEEDYEDGSSEDEEMEMQESGNEANVVKRAYTVEEKIQEASDIGYKVIGPLRPSDRVFKPYEPVFAVVQVGSHQFKVSNGDCIYVEKLKHCDVNDKLILNKVMMLGSATQTIIGRPILPEGAVHAIVEEHALDAKVIIFKKKRRKNYRRTNGHRQELTRLRITDIQGIEKPEAPPTPPTGKVVKSSSKKAEKVAIAA